MAFKFGKGKAPAADGDSAPDTGFQPDPSKAQKWFEQARAVQETGGYEYAIHCWVSGLRHDPGSMPALESLAGAAAAFLGQGKKSPSKDTLKSVAGKLPVDRYLAALLAYLMKPRDANAALKCVEAAAEADLGEPAFWLGERAIALARGDKKPRKDIFLKLMTAFEQVGAFDKAVECGNHAVKLDPSDAKLANEVRNLSAQAAMTRGGFENNDKQGGFRSNIKDSGKQRELDDADRIVKTEDTVERLVEVAKRDWEDRPEDLPATRTYVRRLRERGKNDDIKLAYQISMKTFQRTGEFSFRQEAGDIRLRHARRRLVALREQAGSNEQVAAALPGEERKFLDMEIDEFRARVEAYPTESVHKIELADRLFQTEQFEEAIPLLQASKDEAKHRARALRLLGKSFARIGYVDESIAFVREAIEAAARGQGDTLDLRYELMLALRNKAEQRDSDALDSAKEADAIASKIAMENFGYKDIKQQRDALKGLIKDLGEG